MIIYLQSIEDPVDREKFEQLYKFYRGYMLKHAAKILKNEFDAEDAVHNAFLSISKHMDKVQDPFSKATKGYLTIIVERKAIDLYRKRNGLVSLEYVEDEIGLSFPPPGDDGLANCIIKLSPRYRHFIMLKYHHGYTVKEIADMFGIKHDAASKLDQRAKARLEELCQKEGVYDLG
nr:sigma-70 family RNA polymerase sigma factor [uncultured Oscillibacter sp.]